MISSIGVFVEGLIFGSGIHKSRALKFILLLVIYLMSCSVYRNVYTTVLCLSSEIRAVVVVCLFVRLSQITQYVILTSRGVFLTLDF